VPVTTGMLMTHEIDVNLVRTNIRRADSHRLKQMRYNSEEPIYSVVRRVLDMIDTEKSDMSFMIEEYRNSSQTWKDKYNDLLNRFEEYKKKVHGTMEEFIKLE